MPRHISNLVIANTTHRVPASEINVVRRRLLDTRRGRHRVGDLCIDWARHRSPAAVCPIAVMGLRAVSPPGCGNPAADGVAFVANPRSRVF